MGTRESIFHSFAQRHVLREGDPRAFAEPPRQEYGSEGAWWQLTQVDSIETYVEKVAVSKLLEMLAEAAASLASMPLEAPGAFAHSARINALLKQVAQ
jgi:hypothetical protein